MNLESTRRVRRSALLALAAAGASVVLSGCAGLVVGGAVGGALVAVDRRTSGAQLEDQAIEIKAELRLRETLGGRAHVNVTSYNRLVLLTGEVPTAADRTAVEQLVSRLDNVRSIVNEVAVMGNSSLAARSSDAIVTAQVKGRLIDAQDVQASAIKVLTERGVVHLMGRVTEKEAARATEIARGTSGVQKVVRVFEIITEAELARLQKGG